MCSLLEMRRMPINNSMYDVVTKEEYFSAPQVYDTGKVAVMHGDYVLPVTNDPTVVGINMSSDLAQPFRPPETEEEKRIYSKDNMIDMSQPKSYGEVIEKTHAMRDVKREILMNVENVTVPNITSQDSPAMAALKTAIIKKQCDIDKYADEFGPNFPNEKRLLKDKEISLKKLVNFGNAMGMEVEVIIRDANDNVPNPMGCEIKAVLTGGSKYGEEDEEK